MLSFFLCGICFAVKFVMIVYYTGANNIVTGKDIPQVADKVISE